MSITATARSIAWTLALAFATVPSIADAGTCTSSSPTPCKPCRLESDCRGSDSTRYCHAEVPASCAPSVTLDAKCVVSGTIEDGGDGILNVRDGPSARNRLLAPLPEGTGGIECSSIAFGAWRQVAVNGVRGWASGRYLKVLSAGSSNAGPAPEPPARWTQPAPLASSAPAVRADAVARDLLDSNAWAILKCFHPGGTVSLRYVTIEETRQLDQSGFARGTIHMKGLLSNYEMEVSLQFNTRNSQARVEPGRETTLMPANSSCALRNWTSIDQFDSAADGAARAFRRDMAAGVAVVRRAVVVHHQEEKQRKAQEEAATAARAAAEAREAEERERRRCSNNPGECERRRAAEAAARESEARRADARRQCYATCEGHRGGCLSPCEGLSDESWNGKTIRSRRTICKDGCYAAYYRCKEACDR